MDQIICYQEKHLNQRNNSLMTQNNQVVGFVDFQIAIVDLMLSIQNGIRKAIKLSLIPCHAYFLPFKSILKLVG